jgi:glycosyltransferase involved in cell wall biosynthesis
MANQTRQLRLLLQQSGAEVTLIAVNAPYRPAWCGKIPGFRALVRFIPYVNALRQQLAKVDVVHIMANSGWSWHLFAAPAIWVAHLLKKPVVLNYRGGYAETFFQRQWRFVAPSIARCSAVVVPSPYLQRVFAQYGISAVIAPNVLDHGKFYPLACHTGVVEALQQSVNTGDADTSTPVNVNATASLHIIVTRNLEAIYGIDTALQALALLRQTWPHAHLSIAGSGPEFASLQQLTTQLNLTDAVVFLGRLDIDAMANLYRSADIIWNPSRVDNSPNSVIEAMACGVPVISTHVGGIPDLVTHEQQALLIAPDNAHALVNATRRLLQEPRLRRHLIDAGLEKTKQFAWSQISQTLFQLYRQPHQSVAMTMPPAAVPTSTATQGDKEV